MELLTILLNLILFDMIFFTENITPFNAANGMRVTPIACELNDNRTGFRASDAWKDELESKGVHAEVISEEDLKSPEGIF